MSGIAPRKPSHPVLQSSVTLEPVIPPPLPTMMEYCVKIPLYAEYPLKPKVSEKDLYSLLTSSHTIDFFCLDCQLPSTFVAGVISLPLVTHFGEFGLADRVVNREFVCTRNPNHRAYFNFRVKDLKFSKVGQSPSMADISETELLPYKKVLKNADFRELSKAVGLAAHGVGIGSFVYLRRIFERLINEARDQAASHESWDESLFEKSRMDEKIQLLHSYLPDFLVEERKMYSILSKGIHSLSENECLDAFPVVRAGIELILDEKVLAKQRQEKTDLAKKNLALLREKMTDSGRTIEGGK